MSNVRLEFQELLGNPAPREPRFKVEWPTQANTDPDWWALWGKKIKVEDINMQCMLDLFLHRDPDITGSAHNIKLLVPSKPGWSLNQKMLACAGLLIRDNNPVPLVNLLRAQVGNKKRDNVTGMGIMFPEQYARYIRFYGAAVFCALAYIKERTTEHPEETKKFANLRRLCIWFLECVYYWLNSTLYLDDVYTAGIRRVFSPEVLDGPFFLTGIFQNSWINTQDRDMGHSPGSMMNGGMPRATDIWLGLDCRKDGLLVGCDEHHNPLPNRSDQKSAIEMVKSEEPYKMMVEKPDNGSYILAYYPLLHWRPGGDILVAIEMRRTWDKPTLWFSPDKTPIPSEFWGFDPESKEIVSKNADGSLV